MVAEFFEVELHEVLNKMLIPSFQHCPIEPDTQGHKSAILTIFPVDSCPLMFGDECFQQFHSSIKSPLYVNK